MALGFIALNLTGPGKGLKGLKLADEAADGLKYLDEVGDVKVIGRSWDTAVAKSWEGHDVLDIPNWTPK
ncbi:MAG: hypothetical protein ACYC5A_11215 [Thermoleophilia bacterium]